MPNVMMVQGGGASGRCLDHESRAHIHESSGPMKRDPTETSLTPCIMWGYNEKSGTQRRALPYHAGTLILKFQPSKW